MVIVVVVVLVVVVVVACDADYLMVAIGRPLPSWWYVLRACQGVGTHKAKGKIRAISSSW